MAANDEWSDLRFGVDCSPSRTAAPCHACFFLQQGDFQLCLATYYCVRLLCPNQPTLPSQAACPGQQQQSARRPASSVAAPASPRPLLAAARASSPRPTRPPPRRPRPSPLLLPLLPSTSPPPTTSSRPPAPNATPSSSVGATTGSSPLPTSQNKASMSSSWSVAMSWVEQP